MGVDAKHPDYADRVTEWTLMRDAIRGESAVKKAGTSGQLYLPMPSGFVSHSRGVAMYDAYKVRAQFPEITSPTINGMNGTIHRTPSQIDLPPRLEYLRERATKDGLPLDALHRRITLELLSTARYTLIVDAPPAGGDPYLVGYRAESLINWSKDRDFFVLDETERVRTGFEWKDAKKYRELFLDNGVYTVRTYDQETGLTVGQPVAPTALGGRENFTEIPLVVIGARDLSVDPETPPLLGVARAAMAIYRLDADYRYQLFMTGQETLVVINGDAPDAWGPGVVLSLKGEPQVVPDAKYVGPRGTGIAAHRTAIQDERMNAVQVGARLFESAQENVRAESGEALKVRAASQNATLSTIADAAAQGLEKALRHLAVMLKADPNAVKVKPNKKWADTVLSAQEVKELVAAWQSRAISYETLYENLQRGEIASSDRTAEEERALLETEDPLGVMGTQDPPGTDPTGSGTGGLRGSGAGPGDEEDEE